MLQEKQNLLQQKSEKRQRSRKTARNEIPGTRKTKENARVVIQPIESMVLYIHMDTMIVSETLERETTLQWRVKFLQDRKQCKTVHNHLSTFSHDLF